FLPPSGRTCVARSISAWGCEQPQVLAQFATNAKSNEVTTVRKLLQQLSLKDMIVTGD
ncbi:MAG: hypothetical protein QOF90_311, partial [Acetobacteraceae bacterium]|nr:hypothetical protein [Acetobacteraceae bacterium]